MKTDNLDFGMIGLGTMGSNLVQNMADHGFTVAVYDKQQDKIEALQNSAKKDMVYGVHNLPDFLAALKSPRNIIMLVPAGAPVDSLIADLSPLLDKEDLLIDLGNSHYTDTNRRMEQLEKTGLNFMGIGISGGEEGARNGPSIMPGGKKETYERIAPMLSAIAAKADNAPCVAYMGSGSAGHYVKMVHNGIEYGLMQLIAESYHLMKHALRMNNAEMQEVFSSWNKGPLQSFLVEITAAVLAKKDDLTKADLIDVIADRAGQKGTGGWTSQSALDLGVPIPVIDAAVSARNTSALIAQRELANQKLNSPEGKYNGRKEDIIEALGRALQFATIITYSQGLSLLKSASAKYDYGLSIADIAGIWRAGCIIRSVMLQDIKNAFVLHPDLESLITDDLFSAQLSAHHPSVRQVIITAVESGLPVPAYMAALASYDSFSSKHLPANLIQGLRDYFGAHTYQRNDRPGTFHTNWNA